MKLRVSVLAENRALHSLEKEHGLSLFIESEHSRVLFDTGASPLLWRNAEALGLAERLKRLHAVVISHGHYDHSGGLLEVLKRQEERIALHVGRGFFAKKVKRKGARVRSIGFPGEKNELHGANQVEEYSSREIRPGFFITGEIPPVEEWEVGDRDLCLQGEDGELIPDPIKDERALAVSTPGGLVIFVGCAHRGLVNSLSAARTAAGTRKVRAVIGGAHLRAASRDRIRRTVEKVKDMDPEWVALGHCTGREAERAFTEALKERFQSLRGGMAWDFA